MKRIVHISLQLTFLLSIWYPTYCQDTVFVNKHHFNSPVRNVFKAENNIYVKAGSTLFKRNENSWQPVDSEFTKSFVFYENGFYESEFIPQPYSFNARIMQNLIPQESTTNATIAQVGSTLFLAVGGNLYEYSISQYHKRTYKNESIRDIYIDDSLKVVSTYSGIYINDSIKVKYPHYSNGPFIKLNNRYYLCNDVFMQYYPPDQFIKQAWQDDNLYIKTGHFRNVVSISGQLYGQFTHSICRIDSLFQPEIIHDGYTYYDVEHIDGKLIFCTESGEVFKYQDNSVTLLFNINSQIRNIYTNRNITYFSAYDGVYTLENLDPTTLTKISDLPFCVGVMTDAQNNTWISTEDGLHVLPANQESSIAVIEFVEFNREALLIKDDILYAGSIDGLYLVDLTKVNRDYIPAMVNKREILTLERNEVIGLLILAVIILGSAVGLYFKLRRKPGIDAKEEESISLDEIAADIIANNILSGSALAEFYDTNTVQLNRIFKNFDTTPGKFLRKVKLDLAKKMLDENIPIGEIVIKTGYSAQYLRKNIDTL